MSPMQKARESLTPSQTQLPLHGWALKGAKSTRRNVAPTAAQDLPVVEPPALVLKPPINPLAQHRQRLPRVAGPGIGTPDSPVLPATPPPRPRKLPNRREPPTHPGVPSRNSSTNPRCTTCKRPDQEESQCWFRHPERAPRGWSQNANSVSVEERKKRQRMGICVKCAQALHGAGGCPIGGTEVLRKEESIDF